MAGIPLPHSGPLTREQLLRIWRSTTDAGFAQPLVDLGEGEGLEVYTQGHAQLARASTAVDVTTQAMFILPWSGQSNPSAQGEQLATVQLSFQRSLFIDQPLVVGAGQVFFEELTTDWGSTPGQPGEPYLTGRRYTLVHDLVFAPGEAGPLAATATAARPGYGYDNPLPRTIAAFVQPGAEFNNVEGTVASTPSTDLLVVLDDADTLIPDHVGQYLHFTAGSNAGKVKRVAGYVQPDLTLTLPTGGTALLDRIAVVEGAITGAFAAGENVTQAGTGATGKVLKALPGASPPRLVLREDGAAHFGAAGALTGAQTGATLAPTFLANPAAVVPEAGTASWEVLPWGEGLGLVVWNEQSPTGGRLGMLDALGKERAIYRSPGEPDKDYSRRIATPADTVSPGAIRRAANRVLAPFGISICFREAGLALLPGMYSDAGTFAGSTDEDAYDLDSLFLTVGVGAGDFQEGENVRMVGASGAVATGVLLFRRNPVAPGQPLPFPFGYAVARVKGTWGAGTMTGDRSGATVPVSAAAGGLRPEARHKWWFDYLEMRAFFLIGVPTTDMGDFGIAYDAGPHNAYDAGQLFNTFWDGYAVTSASLYRQVWQAVDRVRAGGVGFDLEREDLACV